MEQWQEPITPIIWLVSGLTIVTLLLVFIFLFVRAYIKKIKTEAVEKNNVLMEHQTAILQNTVESQEVEKERIAALLHDNILTELHRLKLMNEDKEISEVLSQNMEKLRRISHDLMPPFLENLSFEELMLNFIKPFQKQFSISIQSNSDYNTTLKKDKKLQFFRIFQELIINCSKHSNAKNIIIYWRKTRSYHCLIVADNGKGFDPKTRKGLGLKNIEMRIDLIKSLWRIKSNKNKGTRFIIFLKT